MGPSPDSFCLSEYPKGIKVLWLPPPSLKTTSHLHQWTKPRHFGHLSVVPGSGHFLRIFHATPTRRHPVPTGATRCRGRRCGCGRGRPPPAWDRAPPGAPPLPRPLSNGRGGDGRSGSWWCGPRRFRFLKH